MTFSFSRALIATLTVFVACSSASDKPVPAVAMDTSSGDAPVASSTASKGGIDCPRTGKWALCSVEKRLRQAGFVPLKTAQAGQKRAGFSVAPTTYTLGHAQLEVFLYADAKSLASDWSKLDTLRGAPRGTTGTWPLPPTVLRSANLAAVFLTDSPTDADRLTLALTAGAPQPGSTQSATRTLLPAVQVESKKPGRAP